MIELKSKEHPLKTFIKKHGFKFKIDKITYSKCSLEQRITLAKIAFNREVLYRNVALSFVVLSTMNESATFLYKTVLSKANVEAN